MNRRWLVAAVGAVTLVVLLPGAQAKTKPPASGTPRLYAAGSIPSHGATPAVRTKEKRGHLNRDYATFDALKNRPGGKPPPSPPPPPSPSTGWNGVYNSTLTPSDSTGAMGPTRYVELVNVNYGIYDRSGNTISTGSLSSLAGWSSGFSDPQIIWDPDTGRFYYTFIDVYSDTFAMGFSRTSSPSSSADWCKFQADYGYGFDLPDYPKLGDTSNFLLVGVNVFDFFGTTFLGADVNWLTKPPPVSVTGTTCPAASTFNLGTFSGLKNGDGTDASTPVPVNQIDGSTSGWVVAGEDPTVTPGNATYLSLFNVTGSGVASISAATTVPVAGFTWPPNAPQSGTSAVLDTLDGRLTQAVSGNDTSRTGSPVAIWTQHAVRSSAGRSEERWYEIDPANHALFQAGSATSSSLYVFNGAVSPDRVAGAAGTGDSMVLGFNTSSSSTYPAVAYVRKTGAGAQSGFTTVKQSPGPNVDFSCSPCRWGDYSGATPDPSPSNTDGHGTVWLTQMWASGTISRSSAVWRSWNWSVAL